MKSINRILALLIIATLMVGCFAINASAGLIKVPQPCIKLDSNGSCFIQGLGTPAEMAAFIAKHGISWDGSKWVLENTKIDADVLKDELTINTADGLYFSVIGIQGDVTLEIKGDCSLSNEGYSLLTSVLENPSDTSKLTIIGDGTLTIETNEDITKGIISCGNLTIKDSVKINVTSKDMSIKGVNDIYFEGTPQVNCISTSGDVGIHANHEIVFKLQKGGRVHAEAKNGFCAMAAASSTTIILNDAIITEPLEGKLSPENDNYFIVDANGDYAKVATVEIPDYVITEVEQTANWKIGGKDGAVLTSTANNALFQSVTVDGKTLTEGTDFDRTSGSTIIKFKPAFLDKLSVGKHNVEIISKYGSAKGYLIIEDDKIVQTSDNSAVGAFVSIATFSTLAFVSLKKKEY